MKIISILENTEYVKDNEDMYQEIILLRKETVVLKEEKTLLRTKLQRTQAELIKKSKQMEILIDGKKELNVLYKNSPLIKTSESTVNFCCAEA